MLLRTLAIFGVAAVLAAGASIQPGNPAVVSVDLLRQHLNPKVRQGLLVAMEKSDSGDHEAAIRQLRETLKKYPDSAPFVDSLLGVEFVKVSRFGDAVSFLEQAAALLPHDAMTHYNFGLALICAGNRTRARQEIQRAVELDPADTAMRARLSSLTD
jgi:Flp pilus assembly protein TadD